MNILQKDRYIDHYENAPETASKQEMPYERFLSSGAGSLTNAELLAIIVRSWVILTGTPQICPRFIVCRWKI